MLSVKWILLRIRDHYNVGKYFSCYLAKAQLKAKAQGKLKVHPRASVVFISMWETAIKVLLL